MAFAGLKKQINKANQYVTEKMGGAEGTKLDLDFMEMERKTDVTVELVEELQAKTKEYLQPNPTARAKMAAVKASALVEMGDSLKQMADVKYSLDDNIKQNFLEPLHQLQTKDLKEVMHHRKKLQGRRLDFDCKKRRQAKDDEIRSAEEKFAESLQLAQVGMYNLLENDVEQVSQLVTFAEGMLDYHSQCSEILKVLVETLNEKREEAAARPKSEFVPKTLADLNIEMLGSQDGMNGGPHFLNPNRLNNSHHHMYSSQQNLSNNKTSSSNHNNNSSQFNRNRLYGSQQSLSSTRSGGTSSAFGGVGGRAGDTSGIDSISSADGSDMRPPSYGSSVDSWLNAWDQPNNGGYAGNGGIGAGSKPGKSTTTSNNGANIRNNNKNSFSSMYSTATTNSTAIFAIAVSDAFSRKNTDANKAHTAMLHSIENDVITLIQRVDENWFEGSLNGRNGYFPQSYVQVTVPLPSN
uniref:Uncharacterized protein n=1 Tax=Anopheles merus TaxID=30066 RepID=A0A182VM92_ANOME